MLGCTETITIIHHNKETDDTYICTTINGASWFSKTTISTSADGAKPVNTYEIRVINPPISLDIANGDYCVKGIVKSIEKPSDLKGLEYFRITSIGDNRRGGLSHIRISGQ